MRIAYASLTEYMRVYESQHLSRHQSVVSTQVSGSPSKSVLVSLAAVNRDSNPVSPTEAGVLSIFVVWGSWVQCPCAATHCLIWAFSESFEPGLCGRGQDLLVDLHGDRELPVPLLATGHDRASRYGYPVSPWGEATIDDRKILDYLLSPDHPSAATRRTSSSLSDTPDRSGRGA